MCAVLRVAVHLLTNFSDVTPTNHFKAFVISFSYFDSNWFVSSCIQIVNSNSGKINVLTKFTRSFIKKRRLRNLFLNPLNFFDACTTRCVSFLKVNMPIPSVVPKYSAKFLSFSRYPPLHIGVPH